MSNGMGKQEREKDLTMNNHMIYINLLTPNLYTVYTQIGVWCRHEHVSG